LTRVPENVIVFKSKLDPVIVELAINRLIGEEREAADSLQED
jgi:hypothetical protein